METDLIFVCRKCEHNLFIGIECSGKQLAKKLNKDCPNCGEEAGELWIFSRLGNWEKEKDNFKYND